jgi:hypothetical protein
MHRGVHAQNSVLHCVTITHRCRLVHDFARSRWHQAKLALCHGLTEQTSGGRAVRHWVCKPISFHQYLALLMESSPKLACLCLAGFVCVIQGVSTGTRRGKEVVPVYSFRFTRLLVHEALVKQHQSVTSIFNFLSCKYGIRLLPSPSDDAC